MSRRVVSFPKKFLWGASTTAHQVEGGLHNQWTVWEQEHAKKLAAQASYQFGDMASWPRVAEEAQRPDIYLFRARVSSTTSAMRKILIY